MMKDRFRSMPFTSNFDIPCSKFDIQIRSRLAPTPSGYLHLGNAVNFILTWLKVRKAGGLLKLRIDDLDSDRCRPEYVEDIFSQLDWLGLDWDEGPVGPDDFRRRHSQHLRLERYRVFRDRLLEAEHLFACTCSRKEIQQQSTDGLYPGTCRHRRSSPQESHALRLEVPEQTVIGIEEKEIRLDREMGDFVVWRRDGLPAYQLASVVDDLDDRINLIVRGEDLKTSTAAQLHLARQLREEGFAKIRFLHHPLLPAADGNKLSKSDNALSLATLRANGEEPIIAYREAARQLGIDPAGIGSLRDLLAALPSADLRGASSG